MKIAIIDAELVGNTRHRFPNLACMKISGYYKDLGNDVTLKRNYLNLDKYDKVFISKVFTKTELPQAVLSLPNVEYGGTGFYYDKAPSLPFEIEHHMPDYHLYDEWVALCLSRGGKKSEFKYYIDYSIGYLTRKCFRHCPFCVNRNYNKVEVASSLNEFWDKSRAKLCFLDDNFFGYPNWKELLEPVIKSGRRFQFKQGLDERLLTKSKILAMSQWKYDNDVIFAFDNIKDKDLIISKLNMIREVAPNWKRNLKFYVFCGFDRDNVWDERFWEQDIKDLFERINILKKFNALPYIMRYERVYDSEYSTFYATLASWCNQPNFFKKVSFTDFCMFKGMLHNGYSIYKDDIKSYIRNTKKKGKTWIALEQIANKFPSVANLYLDVAKINQYKQSFGNKLF